MLRFPSTPQAPQIIEAEKYVCPPWLHPLSCMNDPRLMVPSSVASNGDHAWEELKKSKVLWFLLPLPLMFLWDYMKQISETTLPHQRKKNPSSRCTYQAVVRFKRGDTVKTADMMLDAWSLGEAKSRFHDILDKKLKNATLESLHVERVLC